MKNYNTSRVTEFILSGFINKSELSILIFMVVFFIYIITIVANIIIIVVIRSATSLHKPMYLFIGVFSFLEIWFPTSTVPKFLLVTLNGSSTISFTGCIMQFYFHFSLGATENFLLVMMAFDRYVAICNPLRYMTILNHRLCVELALSCWVLGLLSFMLTLVQISNLQFCGPNYIDHYYCDFAPLVHLSCSQTYVVEWTFFINVSVVLLGCFLIIIVSYMCILLTIMQLASASGRRKAFSTCASHLAVILIYYGTTIFMFVKPPGSKAWSFNKIVSIIPSVVTPLLNPIIYTLRNKEMLSAMQRTISMPQCKQKSVF